MRLLEFSARVNITQLVFLYSYSFCLNTTNHTTFDPNFMLAFILNCYDDFSCTFGTHSGFYPVNKNMPMVAGAIKWSKELRDRIQFPYNSFSHVSEP